MNTNFKVTGLTQISDRTTNQLEQSYGLELNNAKRWMDVNKLSPNIHKSTAMLIQPKSKIYSNNSSSSFKFDSLPQVDQVKYLGVEIDSQAQLNFKKHINSIQNKISKGVGILFKLSKILFHQIQY